jgi:hypothetical protein
MLPAQDAQNRECIVASKGKKGAAKKAMLPGFFLFFFDGWKKMPQISK